MNEKKPLVSVVMSVYNEASFVSEAISSILNQTYRNIELIIVDDASSDNTVNIIETINDVRIKLIKNEDNKRLAHNLNVAIRNSTGEYIARMDGDDISLANRIEKQVEYMESHKEIDVCGTYAQCFGDTDKLLTYPISHEDIKAELLFENALCHPSVMIRKESVDFNYNESFAASQDYELWSRLIWTKTFGNIPEPLLKYRVHSNQTKKKNGQQQKIGAIIARKQLLSHLFGNENFESLFTIFIDSCAIGRSFSSEELQLIEKVYDQILKQNEMMRLFEESILKKKMNEFYFLSWYYSFGVNKGVTLNQMRHSKYSYCYRKASLKRRISIVKKAIVAKLFI